MQKKEGRLIERKTQFKNKFKFMLDHNYQVAFKIKSEKNLINGINWTINWENIHNYQID